MKLTNFQKTTVILLSLYILWEIAVQIWAQSEETAIIRADLAFVYPVLLVFILISLFQYFKNKK